MTAEPNLTQSCLLHRSYPACLPVLLPSIHPLFTLPNVKWILLSECLLLLSFAQPPQSVISLKTYLLQIAHCFLFVLLYTCYLDFSPLACDESGVL